MSTRNFVPNADSEGGIGKPSKYWLHLYTKNINGAPSDKYITEDKLNIALDMLRIKDYIKATDLKEILNEYVSKETFTNKITELTFNSTALNPNNNIYANPVKEFSQIRLLVNNDPVNAETINTSLQAIANQTYTLQQQIEVQHNSIYVNGTKGNDVSGDGSQLKPYRTIQKAVDSIGILNTDGANSKLTTINIASGTTYAAPVIKHKNVYLFCGTTLNLSGNLVLDDCAYVSSGCSIVITSQTQALSISNNSIFSPNGTITINCASVAVTLTNHALYQSKYVLNIKSTAGNGIEITSSELKLDNALSLECYKIGILANNALINISDNVTIDATINEGINANNSNIAINGALNIKSKTDGIKLISNSKLSLRNDDINKTFTHTVTSTDKFALYADSNSLFSSNVAITLSGGSDNSVIYSALASTVAFSTVTVRSTNSAYGIYAVLGGQCTYNMSTYIDCVLGNMFTASGGRIFTGKQISVGSY